MKLVLKGTCGLYIVNLLENKLQKFSEPISGWLQENELQWGLTTDTNIKIFQNKCFLVGEKPNASVY